jgi:hypothetical protein
LSYKERYNAQIPKLPRGVSLEEYKQKTVKPIQLRVINIIKSWIDTSFFDFDQKMVYRLSYFIDSVMVEDGHEQLAKQLRNGINKRASKNVRLSKGARVQNALTITDKVSKRRSYWISHVNATL